MDALYHDVIGPDVWRSDPARMGGDSFTDVGLHEVDLLLWLAGAPPVEVVAFSPHDRPAGTAIITAQARLANGAIVSIAYNDNVAMGDEFAFGGYGGLAAYGDRGVLSTDWASFGCPDPETLWLVQNGVRQPLAIEGDTISPAAAFVATVLDGAPNIAPVDEAAQSVAFVQGAYQSAREGRVVMIA